MNGRMQKQKKQKMMLTSYNFYVTTSVGHFLPFVFFNICVVWGKGKDNIFLDVITKGQQVSSQITKFS